MKQYILMADIIHSTEYDGITIMNDFKRISALVNQNLKQAFLSPITITLGDEFQSVIRSLKDSIDVIIMFEELLIKSKIKFKLRYVLHYGDIKTRINPKKAYGMLGGGLSDARKMLEREKHKENRFLISLPDPKHSKLLNKVFFIFQSFRDSWRPKDYEFVAAFLKYKDYKKVARILKKDISTAWRREKSLKIEEYRAVRDIVQSLSGEKICQD